MREEGGRENQNHSSKMASNYATGLSSFTFAEQVTHRRKNERSRILRHWTPNLLARTMEKQLKEPFWVSRFVQRTANETPQKGRMKMEHIDYDVVKSGKFLGELSRKLTVRINIFKAATDKQFSHMNMKSISQVELLKKQSQISSKNVGGLSFLVRLFRKIELSERLSDMLLVDPIESWLNCLTFWSGCYKFKYLIYPHAVNCNLYYINRDTLFFLITKDSALIFLQLMVFKIMMHMYLNLCPRATMMALYVASHLQKILLMTYNLMADCSQHHHLPCLIESKNQLPDILCDSFRTDFLLKRRPSYPLEDQNYHGNAVSSFVMDTGARIVRIATHPSAMRLWIRFLLQWELLTRYYGGQLTPISVVDDENDVEIPQLRVTEAAEKKKNIKPRTDLPPLLVNLHERRPEKLHYLGVSFGLTLDLFRFWKRRKFAPFYIGQIPNTVTGEYSCMVTQTIKQ
ncbi:hypothetical protein NC651_013009 [Populus alba x Populus x berolinensis]|nr:hypothetical protein NC651_013009 [Populus alba x Populus x berolinensis]